MTVLENKMKWKDSAHYNFFQQLTTKIIRTPAKLTWASSRCRRRRSIRAPASRSRASPPASRTGSTAPRTASARTRASRAPWPPAGSSAWPRRTSSSWRSPPLVSHLVWLLFLWRSFWREPTRLVRLRRFRLCFRRFLLRQLLLYKMVKYFTNF